MKKGNGFRNIVKRIPYSTISIDHKNLLSILEKASEFERDIDKKVRQMERQNINVSACPEYFENMVDTYTAKLLSELETEYVKNMRVVGYFFRKRAADKIEFLELLDRIEAEIVSAEEEYKMALKLAEELNPLKNGRLETKKLLNSQKEEELDA